MARRFMVRAREVEMTHSREIRKVDGPMAGGNEAARSAELAPVTLKRPIEAEGRRLPAGSRGTVVAAYRDGTGFEVEFFEPFHAVVTLEADDLAA